MTQRTDWGAWSIKTMENKTMDYEKAYKEAFERAKNYHDNNFSFGTTQLTEAIFPELKESEDERIRRMLIEVVNITPAAIALEHREEMLTYLEKQKEQKPAEWSEDDEEMLKWLCRIVHSQRVEKVISLKEESELGRWMDKWLNHNPQPHWKPSAEQMKALEFARVSNTALKTLYNDLKKL